MCGFVVRIPYVFGFCRGLRVTLLLFLNIYSLSNIYLSNHSLTTAVVRPVMTYGSAVWHLPKDATNKKLKTSTNKPTVMRNRCVQSQGRSRPHPFQSLKQRRLLLQSRTSSISYRRKQDTDHAQGVQAKVMTMGRKAVARGKAGRKRAQQPSPGAQKHGLFLHGLVGQAFDRHMIIIHQRKLRQLHVSNRTRQEA